MQLCRTLAERWPDPRVKLFVVWRLLQLRGSFPHVMQHGGYLALSSAGREAQHLVRFARTHETGWVLAVVPRHGQRLANDGRETDNHESILRHDWSDTVVRLPAEAPRRWYHVLTNSERIAEPSGPNGELELAVGGVLAPLPVGLLVSERIL
jgi:(1->4)-alpha-D-glucan 1-alpha-D-glucosylmutase